MNHPKLDAPHFSEYSRVFHKRHSLPYFHHQFCYKDFVAVSRPKSTYLYLSNLITSAPEGKTPVLQFNRSTGRIDWFRRHFPQGIHLFLLRDPAHQFESYYQQKLNDNLYFLAMNLYIIYLNPTFPHFKDLVAKLPAAALNKKNIAIDLSRCLHIVQTIPIALHYEVFYTIWLISFLKCLAHVDHIVIMDDRNACQDVQNHLCRHAETTSAQEIDFNDYRMQVYPKLSLPQDSLNHIESTTQENFGNAVGKEAQSYLARFQKESTLSGQEVRLPCNALKAK